MAGESWEQRARNNANIQLASFESTHGKTPSKTPAKGYNPEKAMKEAEAEYLKSKGIVKETRWQKVKAWIKGER